MKSSGLVVPKKKIDAVEINYQINQLREAVALMIRQAEKQTWDSKNNSLKNKIRTGQLAELSLTLDKAHDLINKVREFPVDDLEVEI